MKKTKRWMLVAAISIAAVLPVRIGFAADQNGLTGEFSLPDRLRNLVDSQDDYFDAVQRLQDADAAVMRARESAMKDAQSAPDYCAAVKAVDDAFHTYIEKKNALVEDMEKKDPIYSKMKSQVAAIDAQIEAARQNPGTTQDQFEDLYKTRDTFQRQWQQLEGDAIQRAGLAPQLQAWLDTSKKLSELQDKLRGDIEGTDRLKAAVAEANAAKSAVEEARTAISGAPTADPATPVQARAADLLCRSSRPNFAGNDAWWTYGWTNLTGAKSPVASSPSK